MSIDFKSLNKAEISKTLSKEVWIGWISSLVEAYNMAIFSFIAPLLASKIFLQASQERAVFFAYSLILIGSCFFYPLGAMYYGYLGDKHGRQRTCIYSTLGLAVSTGLMGLVPFQYFSGEIWIYFLILICAQYFFSGGEYHGSIVFSLEHSEEKQSGLMSSLSCLFAVLGLVAANGMASYSTLVENMLWVRVCFMVGACGGILSYLLKNHCRETPAFTAIKQDYLEEVDWSNFIRLNWKNIATVIIVFAFFIVSYTFIFIFLPLNPFEAAENQGFDTFNSLIGYGIFLVMAGLFADRIGVQKMMLLGLFLFSLSIIPLCYFCKNLLVLQIFLSMTACLVIGPIHSWMLHQFEVKNRCRGIFISSAIATSLFGGSTVPICLTIMEHSQSLVWCGLYPLMLGLSACSCLILFRKSKREVRFMG